MASFWVTMAGCGASRVAPGTVGALLGAIVFLAVADLPWWIPLLLIIIGFGISVWAIDFLQKKNQSVGDASWIVVDEGVGIWITLLGWDGTLQMLVAGFVLFRLLDITKPFPVRYFDNKGHSGMWVMLDDVFAGIFAWGILQVLDALRVFI